MQLTKSEYIMFLKHPAWLWLKKHNKDKLPPVDDNTQAIFDAGHDFETYVEQLFPGGHKLSFDNYADYLSLPTRTLASLADGHKTIFQGRFEAKLDNDANTITCITDIINVVGEKTFDLYEIKSSSDVKTEHKHDLSFQQIVLEQAGYTVNKIFVIHLNSFFVRHGDIDIKKLCKTVEVTDEVKTLKDQTLRDIKQAFKIVELSDCPDLSPTHVGLGVFKEWLDIYKSIVPHEKNSIYDLCVLNAETVGELNKLEISRIQDIPETVKLTPKQILQVKAVKLDKPIIETAKIQKFLDSLQYPLYFFDYETLSSLVPYFDGMMPRKQYPFQYSLHVLEAPSAPLKHFSYLHKDNSNPLEPLSRTLQTQIGDKGSIITWNMSFEKTCNTQIGEIFPDFKEFYEKVNERVVDLMIPFQSGWYAHKDFMGSASIKKVLPVMVPDLSYKILGIQEGGAAQRLWMQAVLDGKRNGEKEKILSDLEEYCGLDTLAMVKIYEKLVDLTKPVIKAQKFQQATLGI